MTYAYGVLLGYLTGHIDQGMASFMLYLPVNSIVNMLKNMGMIASTKINIRVNH
jgi:hypothetical protein